MRLSTLVSFQEGGGLALVHFSEALNLKPAFSFIDGKSYTIKIRLEATFSSAGVPVG